MTDTLDTLVAKQAITEVLHQYCHAIDDNDRGRVRSVWHDDGLADYGAFMSGTADEFVDAVLAAHSHATALSHQVTNILIDVDGDRATSVTYVTALVRVGAMDHVARNRYNDTWSRRDGRWAIDERRVSDQVIQAIPNDTA